MAREARTRRPVVQLQEADFAFDSNANSQRSSPRREDSAAADTPEQLESEYTREVEVLEKLHANKEIKEMVGEYDPHVPDVSHAMIRIEARRFNHEKLEEGARMMDSGIGLKNAARAAGVIAGELDRFYKSVWIRQNDSDEDEDDDGAPQICMPGMHSEDESD